MTQLTQHDLDNLATLIAIHENKALSYKCACYNKSQMRKHEAFVATLKKVKENAVEARDSQKAEVTE